MNEYTASRVANLCREVIKSVEATIEDSKIRSQAGLEKLTFEQIDHDRMLYIDRLLETIKELLKR